MQVLASQLHFLANRNAGLASPPLFWPVNCIKIGGHVALLSGPTVYSLYCGKVFEEVACACTTWEGEGADQFCHEVIEVCIYTRQIVDLKDFFMKTHYLLFIVLFVYIITPVNKL